MTKITYISNDWKIKTLVGTIHSDEMIKTLDMCFKYLNKLGRHEICFVAYPCEIKHNVYYVKDIITGSLFVCEQLLN